MATLPNQLRRHFNAYCDARKKQVNNQSNLELSQAERTELLDEVQAAKNALDNTMDEFRQVQEITLTTLSEAKAFAALLRDFMPDHGDLQVVRIGNVGREVRKEMQSLLEAGGLLAKRPEIHFRFP